MKNKHTQNKSKLHETHRYYTQRSSPVYCDYCGVTETVVNDVLN